MDIQKRALELAELCRMQADATSNEVHAHILKDLARYYEREAQRLGAIEAEEWVGPVETRSIFGRRLSRQSSGG